jgi:hypothetical protein
MKTIIASLGAMLSAAILHAAEPDAGFVAHEWGTFTSVQGADGVQMLWNPLVAPDLPAFVYDRSRPRSAKAVKAFLVAGKTAFTCRQRMETPVIYFYSDRARTLDVAVNFPQGTVTEWYPQESAADLGIRTGAVAKARPALHWERVQVLPKTESPDAAPPADPSGSHYFAARETDSARLRVTGEDKKSEVEKFLFYRGVGSFAAPLTVKLDSADPKRLSLTNSGTEKLRSLFIYDVRADGGSWMPMENLRPGETRTLVLDPSSGSELATLPAALVREGLYERESAAMVKTWESSWFAERGLRVLYTLPRAWTDRTLPLAITPAPRETARVMVARAEIITPEMEAKLLAQMERYISAEPAARPKIVADTRALGLGRFTEAVLRRVISAAPRSPEFSSLSWELLMSASFPPKPAASPAAAN